MWLEWGLLDLLGFVCFKEVRSVFQSGNPCLSKMELAKPARDAAVVVWESSI